MQGSADPGRMAKAPAVTRSWNASRRSCVKVELDYSKAKLVPRLLQKSKFRGEQVVDTLKCRNVMSNAR